jgi:hypothetical protein
MDALAKRYRNSIAGICYVCGCTDDNACGGGCGWADVDLCDSPSCLALDDAVREKPTPRPKLALLRKW